MMLGNQISLDPVKDLISILNTTVDHKPFLVPDTYHVTADSLSVKHLNICFGVANRHVTNGGRFSHFCRIRKKQ